MPGKRFPPDDPREWLNRARSSLAKARDEAIEIAEEVIHWAHAIVEK